MEEAAESIVLEVQIRIPRATAGMAPGAVEMPAHWREGLEALVGPAVVEGVRIRPLGVGPPDPGQVLAET